MEIFQTIWTVLTSENERLTNIIISPLLYIEITLYTLIFLSILKIKSTKKQNIIYIILCSSFAIINLLFIPSPYYIYINLLLYPTLVLIVFKTTLIKALLSEVVLYISSLIIDTPLVLLFTYIANISSYDLHITPIYRIVYCIVSYSLGYFIYFVFINNKIDFNILDRIKSNNKTILLNFLLGIIAVASQYYIEFKYINYIPIPLNVLSILVLFFYFIVSIISLFRTSKLELTTAELEKEQLYNQTLGLLYDNIRGFKHDFNNIVQGIGGYISTNNMDGLKEYYSQILDDCQRVNNLSLLSPEVINNPAIYSLLASKYHTANELGIKVNIEVFMDLQNINMKIYELTRVLGILLDNAIEASKECEEKEITLTIRKDVRANKQLFIIENTYLNKDVNIDEIFEKGKTSKTNEDAKNHGLGLWEIRNLVKERKNLNLYTTKDEKYFKQQFEIYGSKG